MHTQETNTFEPYAAFGDDEAQLNQRDAKKLFEVIGIFVLNNYPVFSLPVFNSLTRPHGIPFPLVKRLYDKWIKNQLATRPPRIKQIPAIDKEYELYQVI